MNDAATIDRLCNEHADLVPKMVNRMHGRIKLPRTDTEGECWEGLLRAAQRYLSGDARGFRRYAATIMRRRVERHSRRYYFSGMSGWHILEDRERWKDGALPPATVSASLGVIEQMMRVVPAHDERIDQSQAVAEVRKAAAGISPDCLRWADRILCDDYVACQAAVKLAGSKWVPHLRAWFAAAPKDRECLRIPTPKTDVAAKRRRLISGRMQLRKVDRVGAIAAHLAEHGVAQSDSGLRRSLCKIGCRTVRLGQISYWGIAELLPKELLVCALLAHHGPMTTHELYRAVKARKSYNGQKSTKQSLITYLGRLKLRRDGDRWCLPVEFS